MNIGIIGCGFVSQYNISAWQNLGHQVVAVCDLNVQAAEKVAAGLSKQVRIYTDYKKMLDLESLDAVSVCTPPSSHYAIILKALTKGCKVVVEKPFVMSSKEAKLLTFGSKDIVIVHNQLYASYYREALQMVKEGFIGKVFEVNVSTMTTLDDYMTRDPLHWSHKLKGGRIAECLPHPVYLAQAFTGQDELTVGDARAFKPKLLTLKYLSFSELWAVLYGNQVRATINVRLNIPTRNNVATVDVMGEFGCLKIGIIPKGMVGLFYKISSFKERLVTKMFGSQPCFMRLPSRHWQPAREMIIQDFLEGKSPLTARHGYFNIKCVEEIVEKIAS